MALLTKETTNQTESQQIKSKLMSVFGEKGKPDDPGKNFSGQRREPTNKLSPHMQRGLGIKSNLGHIGGRR